MRFQFHQPQTALVLERSLLQIFVKFGIEPIASKWTGFVPKKVADSHLIKNGFLTENRKDLTALVHGNMHNIQRAVILLWLQATGRDMMMEPYRLLALLTEKTNAKGKTFWIPMLDTSHLNEIHFGQPHQLHSTLLTTQAGFDALQSYLLHSFCTKFIQLRDLYGAVYNRHVTSEQLCCYFTCIQTQTFYTTLWTEILIQQEEIKQGLRTELDMTVSHRQYYETRKNYDNPPLPLSDFLLSAVENSVGDAKVAKKPARLALCLEDMDPSFTEIKLDVPLSPKIQATSIFNIKTLSGKWSYCATIQDALDGCLLPDHLDQKHTFSQREWEAARDYFKDIPELSLQTLPDYSDQEHIFSQWGTARDYFGDIPELSLQTPSRKFNSPTIVDPELSMPPSRYTSSSSAVFTAETKHEDLQSEFKLPTKEELNIILSCKAVEDISRGILRDEAMELWFNNKLLSADIQAKLNTVLLKDIPGAKLLSSSSPNSSSLIIYKKDLGAFMKNLEAAQDKSSAPKGPS